MVRSSIRLGSILVRSRVALRICGGGRVSRVINWEREHAEWNVRAREALQDTHL